MTDSINTDGANFPSYLPKVGASEPIRYSHVNDMSKAVMRNNVSSVIGGSVKRSTRGSAIVFPKRSESTFPFHVGVSGNYVTMYLGNVWAGKTGELPANILFGGSSTLPPMPYGDFDSDITTLEMPTSYPPVVVWEAGGGNKLIWFEKGETNDELPKLVYNTMEKFKESEKVKSPVAFIDEQKFVYQIARGDIWLDPSNSTFNSTHPFKVSIVSAGRIRIEQGMVYSYPNSFVNTGSGDYPNAIKISPSLGGGYLLNSANKEFNVGANDYVYLKFTRTINQGSAYSGTTADIPSWECTLEIGPTLPSNAIQGNYNTSAAGACDDTMPVCGPVVPANVMGTANYGPITGQFFFTALYQKRNVKFLSWGTQIYPIAKMQLASQDKVAQMLRSDFFFYPPLDARMSFTETSFGAQHHNDFL